MPSYLLSWNPDRWQWADREANVAELAKRGTIRLRWSCGNNKHIPPGARVFLLKRGKPPRGIVGSGTVIKGSYRDLHWDEARARQRDECNYVRVEFDALLSPAAEPLPVADLAPTGIWKAQSSGVRIPGDLAQLLEVRWDEHLARAGRGGYQQRRQRFSLHTFTVLDDHRQIARANDRLVSILTEGAEDVGVRVTGHQGGQLEGPVFWLPGLNLWACCGKLKNRFWNAFGLGPLSDTGTLRIVVEINFPFEGIRRNIGGVFLEDEAGEVYVGHRGRIGGGKAGVGKRQFVGHAHLPLIAVRDGKQMSEVMLLGALSDPELPALVTDFVQAVFDFKLAPGSNKAEVPSRPHITFSPEFQGQKQYSTRDQVVAECAHGRVVNALERHLRQAGLQTGNDQHRDLYIADRRGRVKALFEVKTGAHLAHVYQAIGQLFYHGAENPRARLVAVLPADISNAVTRPLVALGIKTVKYVREGHRITFPDLHRVIGRLKQLSERTVHHRPSNR